MSGEASGHPEFLSGRRLHVLVLTVAVAAAGYVLFSLWGGLHQVADALSRVGMAGLVFALALSLLNYALRFLRWQHYLSVMGHSVPALESLRIYLGGFGLTLLPGKAGEAVRSVFLKHHGVPYPDSLAAFFSERLSDLVSMTLLALLGLWTYPAARPLAGILAVILLLALVVLRQRVWWTRLGEWAGKRPSGKLANLLGGTAQMVLGAGRCARLSSLLLGVGLGLVAWGGEGLAFWFIADRLGSSLAVQTMVFIYAFSVLVGALSFLPGGLGGAELTMVGLLLASGMGQPDAVAATLLIRLATLWFAVILGVGALVSPSGFGLRR